MTEQVVFTGDALDALRGMIEDWIGEGFTTPPYSDAEYTVFEALGLDEHPLHRGVRTNYYDTRRPHVEDPDGWRNP